jgi:2-(3-amino-3-carboxypropyl)histidine synthase
LLSRSDEKYHLRYTNKTEKEVFTFNPRNNIFKKINQKDIDKILQKRKARLVKFYSSDIIGVIVSLKPGQNKLELAKKLKGKFKNKVFYFFISETFNFSEMDNFNFIECWINTACPRIEEDVKVLNLDYLLENLV